jgi:hypothetical protein
MSFDQIVTNSKQNIRRVIKARIVEKCRIEKLKEETNLNSREPDSKTEFTLYAPNVRTRERESYDNNSEWVIETRKLMYISVGKKADICGIYICHTIRVWISVCLRGVQQILCHCSETNKCSIVGPSYVQACSVFSIAIGTHFFVDRLCSIKLHIIFVGQVEEGITLQKWRGT